MGERKAKGKVEVIERPLTFPCEVAIQFLDGTSIEGKVHLLHDHTKPYKITPLGDALNSRQAFIPLEIAEGKVFLLGLDSVLAVETDAKSKAVADQRGGLAYFDFVKMALVNGSIYSGVVSFIAPDDHSRMSDFFNRTERFVGLEREKRFTFVRKCHIKTVTFWEEEEKPHD